MILAATRIMMTRMPVEEVRLQEVALHCGISIQTIYNIVGNRAELIRASVADWVASIAQAARNEAQQRDLNPTFTQLTMAWSSTETYSAYVDSAVRTMDIKEAPLRDAIPRVGYAEICADLTCLRDRGMLRKSVDVNSLARQLTLLSHAAICDRHLVNTGLSEIRRDLVNGPGLMLAGALVGEELVRLERGIAEISC